MKRGESKEYKGRTLYKVKKGYIKIYKGGVLTGYSSTEKNANKAIDDAVSRKGEN